MKHLLQAGKALFVVAVPFLLSGCLDEEEFNPNVEASDQVAVLNTIFISNITIDGVGWVVLHPDNGNNGPDTTRIISAPRAINAQGSYSNMSVAFDSLRVQPTDSMDVWVALFRAAGSSPQFELGQEEPIMVDNGRLAERITVYAPSVSVADQPLEDNTVTVDRVITGVRGWVVVRTIDEDDEGDIVGYSYISESPADDIEVELADTVSYVAGQELRAVLHADDAPAEEFNFPGPDLQQVFGYGPGRVVETTFTLQ